MEWTWPIPPVRANLWRRLYNVFIIKPVTSHAINIHSAPSAPFSWCSIVAPGHPEICRLHIKSKVGVLRRLYRPFTQDRLQLHLRERFCNPREGSCAFLAAAFFWTGWKVSSEFAQHRRAWGVSIQDAVSSIGDAGSIRPGWMPPQVELSTRGIRSSSRERGLLTQ